MNVRAIKTRKVKERDDILDLLDKSLKSVKNGSIIAISSKIVSLCEGRTADLKSEKDQLIKSEADKYVPREKNKHKLMITIKLGNLIFASGIDQSNSNGKYVLWPLDPNKSAKQLQTYLKKKLRLKKLGVIITDSKTLPLRKGIIGFALAHFGFKALKDYRGTKDIYGRKMKISVANVADAIAACAVAQMGEGNEQTPIAVISDIDFVKFAEAQVDLSVKPNEDAYHTILNHKAWKKGNQSG